MASRGQIAAAVRRNKDQNPDHYCSNPRCLWNRASGPCPKHEAPERDLPGTFDPAHD
jgi:hypothetical protein